MRTLTTRGWGGLRFRFVRRWPATAFRGRVYVSSVWVWVGLGFWSWLYRFAWASSCVIAVAIVAKLNAWFLGYVFPSVGVWRGFGSDKFRVRAIPFDLSTEEQPGCNDPSLTVWTWLWLRPGLLWTSVCHARQVSVMYCACQAARYRSHRTLVGL